MSAMLSVCASSNKEAPKPEEVVTQIANPDDSAKAPEQADFRKTDAVSKADAADEKAPAPKADEKQINPEEAKRIDLA